MNKSEVLKSLREVGLVPVLRAESVDQALALAGHAHQQGALLALTHAHGATTRTNRQHEPDDQERRTSSPLA